MDPSAASNTDDTKAANTKKNDVASLLVKLRPQRGVSLGHRHCHHLGASSSSNDTSSSSTLWLAHRAPPPSFQFPSSSSSHVCHAIEQSPTVGSTCKVCFVPLTSGPHRPAEKWGSDLDSAGDENNIWLGKNRIQPPNGKVVGWFG